MTGPMGTSCRTPVCSGGCGNGQCTHPGVCTCPRGYTGISCRTPVCSGGCGNGQCTHPGVCTCPRGYTGTSCRTPNRDIHINSVNIGLDEGAGEPGTPTIVSGFWMMIIISLVSVL
ncbi:unnamed protein product, partial [Meganyctiphanes norvegica]